MRLAIISDIHSNLEALTKCVDLIDQMRVDQILCLGDVVGYGADPSPCLRIVRERCSVVLMGNHDSAAVDPDIADDFNNLARMAAHWTHSVLSDEEQEYLSTLPFTAEVEGLWLVHGSPREPEEFHYILSSADADEAFDYFTQRLCFVGHSHVPGIFSERGRVGAINANGRFLINVGSVGQPRDGNPRLSFGVLDTEAWTYRNVRSEYDVQTAMGKILDAGLPPSLAERLLAGV
jgi:predicted phosphodiesterase